MPFFPLILSLGAGCNLLILKNVETETIFCKLILFKNIFNYTYFVNREDQRNFLFIMELFTIISTSYYIKFVVNEQFHLHVVNDHIETHSIKVHEFSLLSPHSLCKSCIL